MGVPIRTLSRMSGPLLGKLRFCTEEYSAVHSLYLRLMSGSSDSSNSHNGTGSEAKSSPNQEKVLQFSTLEENRPDISRNRRQLPSLLKSSYEEEQSHSSKSFAKLFRESNFVHVCTSLSFKNCMIRIVIL